jgi:hypothetical protein
VYGELAAWRAGETELTKLLRAFFEKTHTRLGLTGRVVFLADGEWMMQPKSMSRVSGEGNAGKEGHEMEVDRTSSTLPVKPTEVSLVDNWNPMWDSAVSLVRSLGQDEALRLDEGGWLPARQNLLVASVGPHPVGFLVFRVEPVIDEAGQPVTKDRKPVLEAVVDGHGASPDAPDPAALEQHLRESAMHRALDLRCARFRWNRPQVNA